jgi:hypothetical protein
MFSFYNTNLHTFICNDGNISDYKNYNLIKGELVLNGKKHGFQEAHDFFQKVGNSAKESRKVTTYNKIYQMFVNIGIVSKKNNPNFFDSLPLEILKKIYEYKIIFEHEENEKKKMEKIYLRQKQINDIRREEGKKRMQRMKLQKRLGSMSQFAH